MFSGYSTKPPMIVVRTYVNLSIMLTTMFFGYCAKCLSGLSYVRTPHIRESDSWKDTSLTFDGKTDQLDWLAKPISWLGSSLRARILFFALSSLMQTNPSVSTFGFYSISPQRLDRRCQNLQPRSVFWVANWDRHVLMLHSNAIIIYTTIRSRHHSSMSFFTGTIASSSPVLCSL